MDALVKRLRENRWRGQIVGPHGSGKSALLAALVAAVESLGRPPVHIELHDRQRQLPLSFQKLASSPQNAMVFVDGYEQLARHVRFRLKRICRLHALGLVVTSHASIGLPDLVRTTSSVALARELVAELLGRRLPLADAPLRQISSEEVAERFRRHAGNLREILFDLYDLYEQR